MKSLRHELLARQTPEELRMKVVALISGGKDSIYSIMEVTALGHDVVALANLHPVNLSVQEIDSFCFQTVGHQVIVVC